MLKFKNDFLWEIKDKEIHRNHAKLASCVFLETILKLTDDLHTQVFVSL